MKFIRDIITEKTNQLRVSSEPKDDAFNLGNYDLPDTEQNGEMTQGESGQEEIPFNLLADPEEGSEIDARGSTELFDDVWANGNTSSPGNGATFGPDMHANEDPSPSQNQLGSETDTSARTMYYPGNTKSNNPPTDPVRMQDEPSSKATKEEVQTTSPFRRIFQQEVTLPRVENTEATVEPQSSSEPVNEANPIPKPTHPFGIPIPDAQPARKKVGRVKTRLLGFGNDFPPEPDMFVSNEASESAPQSTFPVAWIVITSGPGRGTAFTLFNGVSQIGRGEDQVIRLDFGDSSISRSNHAAIAYDPEQQKFFLGHGGKANLVRLNGDPVLSTESLKDGAEIRLGETTMKFIALCGAEFNWNKENGTDNHSEDSRFG